MYLGDHHSKMVLPSLQSLLILVTVHCMSAESSSNFTKRCSVDEKSQVIWNVSFTGDKPLNMSDPNVVMETKGRTYRETWKTLKNCLRGRKWMECTVERNPIRHRYFLRIVKKSSQSGSFEYLMKESPDKGHYQDGFLCRPNHDINSKFIKNLHLSNITLDGVDISWTFYKWDIDDAYLRRVTVSVLDVENKVHSELQFIIFGDTPLHFLRHITGLLPCTSYSIEVKGHYDMDQVRVLHVPFTTSCRGVKSQQHKFSMKVHTDEVVVVVISSVVFVVAISLFSCYLCQQKRRRNMQRVDSKDVLDPRDVGL